MAKPMNFTANFMNMQMQMEFNFSDSKPNKTKPIQKITDKKAKKLILIDGSSILSTSFFGSLSRDYYSAKTEEEKELSIKKLMHTSKGEYTNAVFTFCKIISKIIKLQSPTHMAVAWDINRETFRRKLYKGYKANRGETLPELRSQFELMQRVLSNMNIKQFKIICKEADDILGTLSKKFEKEIATFIFTKDQDALQLVSDYTRVWLITSKSKEMYDTISKEFMKEMQSNIPSNAFEFTPYLVNEFYKLAPSQIVDLKSLVGDSSDNIMGVPGIGQKTAVPLLREFGTIENLYDRIENLNPKEEKEMKNFFKDLEIKRSPLTFLLKQPNNPDDIVGKKAALLSKKLAKIDRYIPQLKNISLDSLKLEVNIPKMKEEFLKLEFKSLLK